MLFTTALLKMATKFGCIDLMFLAPPPPATGYCKNWENRGKIRRIIVVLYEM